MYLKNEIHKCKNEIHLHLRDSGESGHVSKSITNIIIKRQLRPVVVGYKRAIVNVTGCGFDFDSRSISIDRNIHFVTMATT